MRYKFLSVIAACGHTLGHSLCSYRLSWWLPGGQRARDRYAILPGQHLGADVARLRSSRVRRRSSKQSWPEGWALPKLRKRYSGQERLRIIEGARRGRSTL